MNIEEKLINAVSRHPYIYDVSSKDYKNVVKKDKAWVQIGMELNLDEDICRRKWKVLRGTYRRVKRGESLACGIQSRRKKWRHLEAMSFLDGCITSISTLGNLKKVSATNPLCDSMEDDAPSTSASPAPAPLPYPMQTPSSAAVKYCQTQDDFRELARQILVSVKQIAESFGSRREESRADLTFAGLAKILNGAGMPEKMELSVINEVQDVVFTAIRSWNERQLERG